MADPQRIEITADIAGQTLAAIVRAHRPELSWSKIDRFVQTRHVRLNGELWLDSARRVKPGDVIELLDRPDKLPESFVEDLAIRHLDHHVVVVEKPAGISTVRHPEERDWDSQRRALVPTLDERLQKLVAKRVGASLRQLARLRKVHRLDKLTSGLVVFARSALAEQNLGRQFHAHTVDRKYFAIVFGQPQVQTIRSWLIRDRGDGRRGSGLGEGMGKLAVTHIEAVAPLGDYSLVTCRLETGRTHQIRIHLAESGHPVCGDPVYGKLTEDKSGAPRLALHAAELGFTHPATGERLHWTMPLPPDFANFVEKNKI
ncbi:MAG: RluA family pseudouridine synthase [Gemmataceae bacterium]